MRGDDNQQAGIFSYVSPEKRVPADHPLRPIRKMVDEILKEMSPQFAKLYSEVGRPSIAPERLFRSLLLQIFYSVRSERMLIEQLQYNLLFRWFVGMEMDEAVWNHAVYSKNRERSLNEEIAESFFRRVLERAKPFMSDEHFTVDATLIEAWASQKSFAAEGRAGESRRGRAERWTFTGKSERTRRIGCSNGSRGDRLRHEHRRFPLRSSIRLGQKRLYQKSVAVLHQYMAQVAQLRLNSFGLLDSRASGSVVDLCVWFFRFSP